MVPPRLNRYVTKESQMKTDRNTDDLSRLLLTILALLSGPPAMSLAQTGGFTYQGRLSDGGTPANGIMT